jgi:hypothetical protein
VSAWPGAAAIGVDIPFGLPDAPLREADRAARAFVGERRSSVFATFPAPVLEAPTYDEAKAICVGRGWPKPSIQSYGMRHRIFEIARLAASDERVFEVHPEVSFRELLGRTPSPKKTGLGGSERRLALADAGIDLLRTAASTRRCSRCRSDCVERDAVRAREGTTVDGNATIVWNRACDHDFQPTRTGDRLLKAVIQFDGLAQNGGVGHAIEVAESPDVEDALLGFRQLGLADAAHVVEAALALDDEEAQEAMSSEYWNSVDGLNAAFERYYANHSEEFGPPD